jgi:hypothetical protein
MISQFSDTRARAHPVWFGESPWPPVLERLDCSVTRNRPPPSRIYNENCYSGLRLGCHDRCAPRQVTIGLFWLSSAARSNTENCVCESSKGWRDDISSGVPSVTLKAWMADPKADHYARDCRSLRLDFSSVWDESRIWPFPWLRWEMCFCESSNNLRSIGIRTEVTPTKCSRLDIPVSTPLICSISLNKMKPIIG